MSLGGCLLEVWVWQCSLDIPAWLELGAVSWLYAGSRPSDPHRPQRQLSTVLGACRDWVNAQRSLGFQVSAGSARLVTTPMDGLVLELQGPPPLQPGELAGGVATGPDSLPLWQHPRSNTPLFHSQVGMNVRMPAERRNTEQTRPGSLPRPWGSSHSPAGLLPREHDTAQFFWWQQLAGLRSE